MQGRTTNATSAPSTRRNATWLSKAARRNVRQRAALSKEIGLHSFDLYGSTWTLHHSHQSRPSTHEGNQNEGASTTTRAQREQSVRSRRFANYRKATRHLLATVIRSWREYSAPVQLPTSGASSSSLRPPGLGGAALLPAQPALATTQEQAEPEAMATATTSSSKRDGKREAAAAGLKSQANTPERPSSSTLSEPPQLRQQKKGKRLDLDVTAMSFNELLNWQPERGTNEWHTRQDEATRRGQLSVFTCFDEARAAGVAVRETGGGPQEALDAARAAGWPPWSSSEGQ